MNEKLRKVLDFIKTFIVFGAAIHVFAIACTLSSQGIIDIIAFISLLICSLYTLEKNRRS